MTPLVIPVDPPFNTYVMACKRGARLRLWIYFPQRASAGTCTKLGVRKTDLLPKGGLGGLRSRLATSARRSDIAFSLLLFRT